MTETEIVDLVVALSSFAFSFIFLVASYILGTVGYLKLAKHMGYKNKIMAWVPVIRMVILNKYMNDKVWGKLKGKLNWLLIVYPIALYALFLLVTVVYIVTGIFSEEVFIVSTLLFLLFTFIFTGLSLVWTAVYYYVTFEFYRHFNKKNHIIWFIMTIFLGMLIHHIAMIVLIKKEEETEEDKEEAEKITSENDTIKDNLVEEDSKETVKNESEPVETNLNEAELIETDNNGTESNEDELVESESVESNTIETDTNSEKQQ